MIRAVRAYLKPLLRDVRKRLLRSGRVREVPGEPVSRMFGIDRGTPIDRYWIEAFLARRASDRPGRALEVGETRYITRFFPSQTPHHLELSDDGTANCVVCDLELDPPGGLAAFDTFVATQVFNFMFETRTAVRHAAALLAPGGILLGSVGGISQISRHDADRWGHFYSFTAQSWERLLREAFGDVEVEVYGNLESACAYLEGRCAEEVDRAVLNRHDPDYPVTICFTAAKHEYTTAPRSTAREPGR
jgi:hypothetical protein